MTKFQIAFSIFCSLLSLTIAKAEDQPIQNNYIVKSFPILDAVLANGGVLGDNTKSWIKKWSNVNLEDNTKFQFKEISGTTSINLKIQKIDANDPKGYKSLGTFLANNESGNPNSEIAYFNLAAIVGVDKMFRPAIRYELGAKASASFKQLINVTVIKGNQRIGNKKSMIQMIDSGKPLLGCFKAKKSDSSISYDEMTKTGWFSSVPSLKSNHPVTKFIQASKDQPVKGDVITLKGDYQGDAFELAREFSIYLTFDSVFGQYDRFTGGNIVIEKDALGKAHFIGSDNGGSYIFASTSNVKNNLKLFSRYDRKVINKIRELYKFLQNPSTPFLGYTDPKKFVVDMGMYFLNSPEKYVSALKDNIGLLLQQVNDNESRYGNDAYFQE